MPQYVRYGLWTIVGLVILGAAAVAGAIAFGTAEPPKRLASVGDAGGVIGGWRPSQPPITPVPARDGVALASYRYPGRPGGGIAVLVHGSSGSAIAMHGVATALAERGINVVVPDIRGHGASGRRGDIDHAGQLLEDLADLLAVLDRERPVERRVLVGHSSGGGFALKAAASPIACGFDGYLALAPFLGFRAPTVRSGESGTESGGWARPFVPRIVGLVALRRLGITAFEGLPTLAFATGPGMEGVLATTYSFRLMLDFGPASDWQDGLRRIARPARVLVGDRDELFHAEAFAPTIAGLNPAIPVETLAGIGHMGIVVDAPAQAAIAGIVEAMLAAPPVPCGQKS